MYVYTYTYTYISIYLSLRQQSLFFSFDNSWYHDLCDSKVSACKSLNIWASSSGLLKRCLLYPNWQWHTSMWLLQMMYVYVTTGVGQSRLRPRMSEEQIEDECCCVRGTHHRWVLYSRFLYSRFEGRLSQRDDVVNPISVVARVTEVPIAKALQGEHKSHS